MLSAPLRRYVDAQQMWRDEDGVVPGMPTTCHRLRSYPSPNGPAVPASQAAQDSSSYSKRCNLRRLCCAGSDGCHEDFGHTFAVAVDIRFVAAARRSPADCRRWAIRSTSQAALVAAVAVGLVSLVHRLRV